MIIRFELENFMSFNTRQSFSMIPSNLRTKQEHTFDKNGVKLLNLSAIYGANASGKTNLIRAIDLFKFIVTKMVPLDTSNVYFRENNENKKEPTKFEIEFVKNNIVYAYGLQVLFGQRKIISEWLYRLYPDKDEEEIVYERILDNDKYSVEYNSSIIKDEDQSRLNFVISDMQSNMHTLLMTEMNRNKKIEKDSTLYFFSEVYDWFKSDLKIFFPNDTITKFDYVIGKENTINGDINNIISSFDTGISKVTLEKVNKEELRDVLPSRIIDDIINELRDKKENIKKNIKEPSVLRSQEEFFQISNISNDDYEVETIKLSHGTEGVSYDFREESDGTRRLFDLLDILLNTDNNKIFIVDELDRSLHPNLTFKFVELFYKVVLEKDIQLIFTTHESRIMDLSLVRQDEIWFIERNRNNESEVYSLDSFKERYDKKVEKAYLEGRYGAIPIFNSFNAFIKEEE